MLKILRRKAKALETVKPGPDWTLDDDIVWVELINPSRAEELAVEKVLGLDLPTREEMIEIEPSSRLYRDRGATFMTASVLCSTAGGHVATDPVTFVLAGDRLITIRYAHAKAFDLFEGDLKRQDELCPSGVVTFLGLVEAVIDRLADVLEATGKEVENIADQIFSDEKGSKFRSLLHRLAKSQKAEARSRESLVSLGRLIGFAALAEQIEPRSDAKAQLDSMLHDVQALADHATHLSDEMTFMLDAATGLINVEQNDIMKVFSVVATILMPPTLIAGIYGMNFKHMPELDWQVGYPMAIGLMLVTIVVPVIWLRRKGWL
jgi:magnesium transporter